MNRQMIMQIAVLFLLTQATFANEFFELKFENANGRSFTLGKFREQVRKYHKIDITSPKFVLIKTPNIQDPAYRKQQKMLDQEADAHDIIENEGIVVISESAQGEEKHSNHVPMGMVQPVKEFKVILISDDGRIVSSSPKPLSAKKIQTLFNKARK